MSFKDGMDSKRVIDISHLLFTDDTLVFFDVSLEQLVIFVVFLFALQLCPD